VGALRYFTAAIFWQGNGENGISKPRNSPASGDKRRKMSTILRVAFDAAAGHQKDAMSTHKDTLATLLTRQNELLGGCRITKAMGMRTDS